MANHATAFGFQNLKKGDYWVRKEKTAGTYGKTTHKLCKYVIKDKKDKISLI